MITSERAWKFPQPRNHLTANAAQSTPVPRHPATYLHPLLQIATPSPARGSAPVCAPATTAIAAKVKPAGRSAAPHLSAAVIHRCLHRSTPPPTPVRHAVSSFPCSPRSDSLVPQLSN